MKRWTRAASWDRLRDSAPMLMAATYSAGLATIPLLLLTLTTLRDITTRSWRWIHSPLDGPLLGLGAAALLSYIASPWRGFTVGISVFALLLVILLSVRSTLAYARGGPTAIIRLLLIWVGGGVAAGIWALVSAHPSGPNLISAPGVAQNGLGSTLALAAVLALALLTSGTRIRLWALSGSLVVLAGALAYGLVRAAWVATAAGAATLLALAPARSRLILVAVIVAAIVGGQFLRPQPRAQEELRSIVSLPENRNRLVIWETAVRIAADHPLTGVGLGVFSRAYARYRPADAPDVSASFAHNIFLNVLTETGILGLAAFGALCFMALRGMIRGVRSSVPGSPQRTAASAVLAATVALLVNQLFDGTLWSVHLGVGIFILFALGVAGEASFVRGPLGSENP